MRPGSTRLLLGIVTAVAASRGGPACASAFLQARGHGQIIVTTFSDGAAAAFDAHGRVVPVSSWQKFELSTEAEYGLTDRFTLLASGAFDDIQDVSVPPGSARGLGITALGGRMLLGRPAGWTLSAEARLRLPGASIGRWSGTPDGTRAVETRLLAGRNLALFGRLGYFDLEIGSRLHPAGVTEALFDASLGLRLRPRFTLLMQGFGRLVAGGGVAARASQKLQASLIYDWRPDVSVQFGAFATVLARNDALERGLVSAVWVRF